MIQFVPTMEQELTLNDVMKLIRHVVAESETIQEAADKLGTSKGALSETLRGIRKPGPSMLKSLGIEYVGTYRRKRKK